MIASSCTSTYTWRAFLSRIRTGRLPPPVVTPPSSQGTLRTANLRCIATMYAAKGDSSHTSQRKRQTGFQQVWKPISTKAIPTQGKLEVDDSGCPPSSSSVAEGSNEVLVTEANVKDGKYSITVEVDAPLMRFVKGKDGSVQKQIEEDLQVKLIFPSSREGTSLVIEGDKVENLSKASERIKDVLSEAVQSRMLDYSHFISLPLAVHSDLVQKLMKFQSTILGETEGDSDATGHISVQLEGAKRKDQVRIEITERVGGSGSKSRALSDLGIDKSIFIKPKTFHLTVLMLKLWNQERVAMASDVLQRISSKVAEALDNRPISIQLKGLTCMKGSPAKARVVYAPVLEVGEGDRLVRACQVIRDAFAESGLVVGKDAEQTLKLHATLMNVRHRKRLIFFFYFLIFLVPTLYQDIPLEDYYNCKHFYQNWTRPDGPTKKNRNHT